MTTGSITEEAKAAKDGCVDENGYNKTEDPYKNIVLDEEYRLAVEHLWKGTTEMPENWNDMTLQEQRDWTYVQINRHIPDQPKSMHFLIAGGPVRGDCGRPTSARPEWLDHEKFRRGQKFAENNLTAVFLAEAVFLFGLYAHENGLRALIVTGKSSEPFTSSRRYLSTAKRISHWYKSDPWTKDTPAYKDIRTVRRMHANIRNKLMNLSFEEIERVSKIEKTWSSTRSVLLEDFRGSCPAATCGQCPSETFSCEGQWKWAKSLNQSEMAVSQGSFVAFVILRPEYFGIHGASDEDLDAFCHVWRGIGYLLGLEDEFNFCNGTLQEVKQRSQDVLEHWLKPNLRTITPEWEHMLRCFAVGIQYYFPYVSYEHVVLYLAEMLNIRLVRLEACLTYGQRFSYKLLKITLQWITRLPGVRTILNRLFTYSIERGLKFTQDELDELKKQSTIAMSEGIEQTARSY